MTDIQATVIVSDKVDSKIEQKIESIGIASEKTATRLSNLNRAISSISSQSLNSFSNAISNLGRTNLSSLNSQLQQLSTLSNNVSSSLNSQSLASVKLQVAQTKLAQEQAKLAILQQRLQTTASQTATAQQRQAIATANLANAQARANTASIRSHTALNQQQISATRVIIAQERLDQLQRRNAISAYNQSGSILRLAGSMAVLVGLTTSAMKIANFGDEYQRLSNKLMLVTDSADQARNRLSTLSSVALSSYSGLNSTVQLYTRLDLALRQMGGTASEAIAITGTLSKAVSLAGLTTAEANSALLQISQAFNKGKLDGDEFRTVMETMPPLADAIARTLTRMNNGITVTRGELLKLAPEGKITGQVMKEAVLDMAETIDQKFAQLTPTISMQLQNLQTQAQMYFGAMFKDSGLANGMASAIQLIANNLDFATKVATGFGFAITVAMGRQTIVSFLLAVTNVKTALAKAEANAWRFGVAMRAVPIGWLLTGLTALFTVVDTVFDNAISKSLFPNFNQDYAKANDYVARLKEINAQLNTMSSIKLANTFTENVETQKQLQKQIKEYKADLKDIEERLAKNAELQERMNKLIENENKAVGMNKLTWQAQIDTLRPALEDVNALLAKRDSITEQLSDRENDYQEILKQQLGVYEQLQDRLDRSTKALEDNKTLHNLTKEEQETHEAVVRSITSRFSDLADKIKRVTKELLSLGAVDLKPTLDNAVANADSKIDQTALAKADKIMAKLQAQRKVLTTSGKDNSIAKAEQSLLSDAEQLKRVGLNGELLTDEQLKNGTESQYDRILKAQTENYEIERKNTEEKKKQAEIDRANKSAKSKARRELERKQEQIKRNNEEYARFVGSLEDEARLLGEGLSNYNKYNELYAWRLKLQQKGMTISESEMETLKQKIDANTKLKELAKGIADEEERSLAKQKEQFNLKMASILSANTTNADKQISIDGVVSGMGATYGVDQGVTQLLEQQNLYYSQLQDLRANDLLNEEQYQMAVSTLNQQTQDAVYQKRIENMHAMGGMYSVMATAFQSFEQNATNSIMNVLNGTQSIGQAMRSLAVTILNEVVRAIVQMGVKWIAQQTMQLAMSQSMQATQTATSLAMASTVASAWATPASLVSLASYGANAVPAMQGIMATTLLAESLAVAGARRNGGTVNAGDLYQVGEGNAPEIYQSRSGRQYMIAGDNGRVFSNKQVMGAGGSKVVNITQNVTINGNGQLDPDTLAQMKDQTRQVVYEVMANESRDAGGMLA